MGFSPQRSAVRVLTQEERDAAERLVRTKAPDVAETLLDMLGLGAPPPPKVKLTASEMRRKKHCPKGHEFTPENTYHRRDDGRRRCRTCLAARRNRKKIEETS